MSDKIKSIQINIVNENNRMEWIDVAKGIAIICTIIGHTINGKGRIFIASFHMALFLFWQDIL